MKIEDLTEIEGQISLDDLMKQTETPRYGFRGCAGCTWYRLDKEGNRRCYWAITKDRAYRPKADYIYPHCGQALKWDNEEEGGAAGEND